MRQTRFIMGMPVIIDVTDKNISMSDLNTTFAYFRKIDARFSTYKSKSEISKYNRGEISAARLSREVKEIFYLAQQTKSLTNGYFDINRQGICDPSGIVKGWAIYKASRLLKKMGYRNFYIDAGGDIQTCGKTWKIGIRHPTQKDHIVKTLYVRNVGVATSGTYERGQHIYNPKALKTSISDVVSLTVIGPNIYEADRFATAAFAMGKTGIGFIDSLPGFAGYVIDSRGIAIATRNLDNYTTPQ